MALKRVELFENNVGVSDMVLLDPLTELAVIDNLKKRFYTDNIYTYIGSVVVSVNPYKKLTLYSSEIINEHRGRLIYELPPHLYAIADDAYRSMRDRNLDQCVIISGESGSGKTEASKYLMQYVAAVSGKGQDIDRVKEQLLQSNPVLEAFGNAKTNRNDNSSRFGKYMDIEFDFKGDPVGGVISNYLLEKSRVAIQSKGERNFHIFYQLLRSGDSGLLESLKLSTEESKYRYLRTDSDPDNTNDEKDFQVTRNAMEIIGFTNEEITSVFQVVASILKLGNVDFDHKTNKNGTDSCMIKNDKEIQEVSEMLQCDVEVLKKALTKKTVETIEDKYDIDLRVTEAVYARDALCKAMYGRLFTWVVNRINDSIRVVSKEQRKCMGVLDIYGFEIFETNAFEQFIINYCNEKLQQIFIELTLKEEQEEYIREDIQWVHVDYFNNSVICDLVEKPPLGILIILDEECLRPGNVSDLTFLEKLNHHHEFHEHYESRQCRKAQNDKTLPHDSFRIHHYAGLVTYSVEGFIDKNNDLLFRDLSQAMFKCRLPILKRLFPEGQGKGSLKRPPTTSTQLRQSISALMKNLFSKNPNYIRCIKPNDHKRAGFFEESLVRHQVRYLGLVENIRVRRAGYVYRQEFEVFIFRYKMLCEDTWPHWHNDPKEGLQIIFDAQGIGKDEYTFGRTKVFIRNPKTIFTLEERRRDKMHDLATDIQKTWRGYILWKKYNKMRNAQVVIASNYRGYKARTEFQEKRTAAIVIASYTRGWRARNLLRHLKLEKKKKWAVGIIYKYFLGWQVRRVYCRHFRRYAGPVIAKCFKDALVQKYLHKLTQNLPSMSPLDSLWMDSPKRLSEASEQLRQLHHRWRCRKYREKFDKNQQYSMREKVTASDLFKDKKLNYAKSVPHEFMGDYVQIRQNAKWKRISIETDDQYVVFADIIQKINRKNGKMVPLLLVVTTKSLLLLDQRTVGLKYRVPVNEIEKLSLSPLNDKLLVIHFRKNENGNRLTAKGDFFLSCDHIFEIAAKIYLVVQEHCSKPPDVEIATRFHAQFKGNLCEIGFKPGNDDIGLSPGQCKVIKKSNRFDILEP